VQSAVDGAIEAGLGKAGVDNAVTELLTEFGLSEALAGPLATILVALPAGLAVDKAGEEVYSAFQQSAITLSSYRGPAGSTLTVQGSGFAPTGTVIGTFANGDAQVSCANGVSSDAPVTDSGDFTTAVQVPTSAPADQPLSCTATQSVGGVGDKYKTASQNFLVTVPEIAVSPVQGPVGTVLSVSGSGFDQNDSVDLELCVAGENPSSFGACSALGGPITTNTSGAFPTSPPVTVTVPAGTAPGDDSVVAIGNAAHPTAPFTVTLPPAQITVSPSAVLQGTAVSVTGSGFSPNETVYLGLDYSGYVSKADVPTPAYDGAGGWGFTTTSANSAGSFDASMSAFTQIENASVQTFDNPGCDTSPGAGVAPSQVPFHLVVTAYGETSGAGAVSPTFEISPPTLTFTPNDITGAQAITISGTNWTPGEQVPVTTWVYVPNDPNNGDTQTAVVAAATPNSAGSFSVTFTPPGNTEVMPANTGWTWMDAQNPPAHGGCFFLNVDEPSPQGGGEGVNLYGINGNGELQYNFPPSAFTNSGG
ncbi:MAG: hypothetical protein ACYDD6_10075, partial [Acidimicrobiales bacterium]